MPFSPPGGAALELRHQGAAVVQEHEESLEPRVGLLGGLDVTSGQEK